MRIWQYFFDFDDPDDNEKRSLLKTFTLIGKEMFEDIKINSWNRKNDSIEPSKLAAKTSAIPIFNYVLELSIRKLNEDEIVDFNLTKTIIEFSRDHVTSLTGTLSEETLMKVVQTIIEVPNPNGRELGLKCVYYAAENRCANAIQMADLLIKHFSVFDESEKKQLNQLFSSETEWSNLI